MFFRRYKHLDFVFLQMQGLQMVNKSKTKISVKQGFNVIDSIKCATVSNLSNLRLIWFQSSTAWRTAVSSLQFLINHPSESQPLSTRRLYLSDRWVVASIILPVNITDGCIITVSKRLHRCFPLVTDY